VKAPTPLEALLKDRVALAIGDDLRAIEAAIGREISSPVRLIHEMGEFIAGAGGKRLRPILLLIAARLAGYQGPRAVRMGCVVELLHTATLIHDDVVDQAPLRRGRPSANARWGDDASILVGDHLYSKSFALMVEDGDPRVLETLARATVSMTEAEFFQLERKRSGTTGEADYLRIITQKTASFMSACCRIGGLLGRADPEQVEGLTRYGLDIGIAFQISDDSLDFVADQVRLGKAVGADLKEGKRTLPLIATLERASPAERDRIQSVLKRHAAGPGEFEEIRLLVERYGGVEYAQSRAQDYCRSAKEALAIFPDGEDKDTLLLVADYVVDRDK
jgi:octaprenyl-diphosphate synthase